MQMIVEQVYLPNDELRKAEKEQYQTAWIVSDDEEDNWEEMDEVVINTNDCDEKLGLDEVDTRMDVPVRVRFQKYSFVFFSSHIWLLIYKFKKISRFKKFSNNKMGFQRKFILWLWKNFSISEFTFNV